MTNDYGMVIPPLARCAACDRDFADEEALGNHLRDKHKQPRFLSKGSLDWSRPCDDCGSTPTRHPYGLCRFCDPFAPPLKIERGGISVKYTTIQDQGPRYKQEDSLLVLDESWGLLAIVADGMGGHAYGEKASEAAVWAFSETFARHIQTRRAPLPLVLRAALYAGQEAVDEIDGWKKPGTTLTAAFFDTRYKGPGGFGFVQVGDSGLWRRTPTAPAWERLSKRHGIGVYLDLCLGASTSRVDLDAPKTGAQIVTGPYPSGEMFLLGTDGLFLTSDVYPFPEIVPEPEKGSKPRAYLESLLRGAREGGSTDNATGIFIRVPKEETP